MRTSSIDIPTTIEVFRDEALSGYPRRECEEAIDYLDSIAPLVTINDQRVIRIPGDPADTLDIAQITWPMDTFRASFNIIYTARRLERTNPQTQTVQSIAGVAFRKSFGKPSVALISALPINRPKATTVHETGHLFKLNHCRAEACVMGESLTLQAYTHRKYTGRSRERLEDLGLVDMHYTTSYDAPTHFCGDCKVEVEAQGQIWSLVRTGHVLPAHLL